MPLPAALVPLAFRLPLCVSLVFPPMNDSSLSISPIMLRDGFRFIASRTWCSMCHAFFCVTLIARANSHELMPFFALAMHHTATNHLSRPSGLSSKIVPTFVENCLRHSLFLCPFGKRA